MSYQLVVSEKPSVGAAYAKVLGATNRQDGYWEGNGYLVSWCVGHLVELAPPNVYDARYVKWSMCGITLDFNNQKNTVYQMILTEYYKEGIEQVNDCLEACGYAPLKTAC